MCCDRKKRRGRRCGLWVLSPSPVVVLDPVPPGGGDCPRQPGQQCDGHCSLGQCFCRACEWVPWACGSQDLDAGVTNLFHVLLPQNAVFLAGRQNRVNVENGKSMGLKSGRGFDSSSTISSLCDRGKFTLPP